MNATRCLRSLLRAPVSGAAPRISDTRVRKVPELTRCGSALSVAYDSADRPVQDRESAVDDRRETLARIISEVPVKDRRDNRWLASAREVCRKTNTSSADIKVCSAKRRQSSSPRRNACVTAASLLCVRSLRLM